MPRFSHISAIGRPIHFMSGYWVGFSGTADRMALFPEQNQGGGRHHLGKILNGHIFAIRNFRVDPSPIMLGSAGSEQPRLTNCEIIFEVYSNLCDNNSPTSQTDRQTTCDRKTALCTLLHRAVTRSQAVARIADRTAPQ